MSMQARVLCVLVAMPLLVFIVSVCSAYASLTRCEGLGAQGWEVQGGHGPRLLFGYHAVEQQVANSVRCHTHVEDVWSLGMPVCEGVCLMPPFGDSLKVVARGCPLHAPPGLPLCPQPSWLAARLAAWLAVCVHWLDSCTAGTLCLFGAQNRDEALLYLCLHCLVRLSQNEANPDSD